jgi:hypothetical protein
VETSAVLYMFITNQISLDRGRPWQPGVIQSRGHKEAEPVMQFQVDSTI